MIREGEGGREETKRVRREGKGGRDEMVRRR